MRSFLASCLLGFLCFSRLVALESTDQAAIEEVIKGYTKAWNEQEGRGFGGGFTEDADFVNIFGMHFSGKAEIELRHINILQSFLKDSKLHIQNIKLREVHPGLVIALVDWKVDGYRQPGSDLSVPGIQREGIFTQAFVQHENKWEITASQNTLRSFN